MKNYNELLKTSNERGFDFSPNDKVEIQVNFITSTIWVTTWNTSNHMNEPKKKESFSFVGGGMFGRPTAEQIFNSIVNK